MEPPNSNWRRQLWCEKQSIWLQHHGNSKSRGCGGRLHQFGQPSLGADSDGFAHQRVGIFQRCPAVKLPLSFLLPLLPVATLATGLICPASATHRAQWDCESKVEAHSISASKIIRSFDSAKIQGHITHVVGQAKFFRLFPQRTGPHDSFPTRDVLAMYAGHFVVLCAISFRL